MALTMSSLVEAERVMLVESVYIYMHIYIHTIYLSVYLSGHLLCFSSGSSWQSCSAWFLSVLTLFGQGSNARGGCRALSYRVYIVCCRLLTPKGCTGLSLAMMMMMMMMTTTMMMMMMMMMMKKKKKKKMMMMMMISLHLSCVVFWKSLDALSSVLTKLRACQKGLWRAWGWLREQLWE